jgi:hypothetical protein
MPTERPPLLSEVVPTFAIEGVAWASTISYYNSKYKNIIKMDIGFVKLSIKVGNVKISFKFIRLSYYAGHINKKPHKGRFNIELHLYQSKHVDAGVQDFMSN